MHVVRVEVLNAKTDIIYASNGLRLNTHTHLVTFKILPSTWPTCDAKRKDVLFCMTPPLGSYDLIIPEYTGGKRYIEVSVHIGLGG